MKTIRLTFLLAVVAMTVAGCVPIPELPGGSPSPTPPGTTSTPDPTPTPSKPALADLVLTPDGLGPLVIGQAPPVTDPALDILVFDPLFCDGVFGDRALWVPNYPETDAFYVQLDVDGYIKRIYPGSLALRSDTGIGVGDSLAQLEAAYTSGFDAVIPNPIQADVYVVEGPNGRLVFEVKSGAVVLIRSESSSSAASSQYATDAFTRGCPTGI